MSDDLRKRLTPEQYAVTQEGATERPFSHPYYELKDTGMFHCVVCGEPLFSSTSKYASGSGWPSFQEPAPDSNVVTRVDRSHGMLRTEILCGNCDAHLGHVFDDGPGPSGQRFCVNGCSLDFVKRED